jgi:hypothetical protein
MPYFRAGDTCQLCFRCLLQSGGTPVVEQVTTLNALSTTEPVTRYAKFIRVAKRS